MGERMPDYGFGPHLMLQCLDCDREKLLDPSVVSEAVDRFPAKIGMKRISQPHVFSCPPADSVDGGLSGVVLVPESHVAVHTFPDLGRAFVDVFSRKEFDVNFAVSYLTSLFGARGHRAEVHSRGYKHMGSLGRDPLDIVGEVKR